MHRKVWPEQVWEAYQDGMPGPKWLARLIARPFVKVGKMRFPNGIPQRVVTDTSQVVQEAREAKGKYMISRYWKAATAFVSLAGTVVASTAANPDIQGVWPHGLSGVLATAGTALGTALVWLKRNEATVAEAEALVQRAQSRL